MIKINIHKNFIPEKEYIISVFFTDFLGIDYSLGFHDKAVYEITLENKKKIIIKDAFFSMLKKETYLKTENIPEKTLFSKNQFTPEKNIPVIYGDPAVKCSQNRIECGIDIFASAFFMLTRWEEYVIKTRDRHGRFPASASFAFKNNFLSRAVVNEYLEMLWNMITGLDSKIKRSEKKFKIVPTHDVDYPLFSKRSILKTILADIIKRKSFLLAIKSFKNIISGRLDPKKDIFNTFEYLMNLSEKHKTKSVFYFMANKKKYPLESHFIKNIMKIINDRGHIIGFHPDIKTIGSGLNWKKEYGYLSENSPQKIISGRQHFLAFETPSTWQIWDDNEMSYDSTLLYPEEPGFRCGVCYPYPVFNIITRKKLSLKESPLIMMEGGLNYGSAVKDKNKMKEKIKALKVTVKKYKGNFVILWHNSNFSSPEWKDAKEIYECIFK